MRRMKAHLRDLLIIMCLLYSMYHLISLGWQSQWVFGASRSFRQKYPYATFLGPRAPTSANPDGFTSTSNSSIATDLDPYFTSVRLLNYQLLHAPSTRTSAQPPIPFLVLALPSVPAAQLSLLASEGATIVPIQPLDVPPSLEKPHISRSRFRDVLAKLRLWQQTNYDRILAVDADSLILSPLDIIFKHPDLSRPMPTLNREISTANASQPLLPSEYLLVARADTWGNQAEWGPNHPVYLCACFMLLEPSEELFAYYQWILSQPEARFEAMFPEQDLLMYAHRAEGNMPWLRMPQEWSVNSEDMLDILGEGGTKGVKSMHVKAWEGAEGGNQGGPRAKSLRKQLIAEMEAYYSGATIA
jgi:alpha-N-acetylglucosamine transferase